MLFGESTAVRYSLTCGEGYSDCAAKFIRSALPWENYAHVTCHFSRCWEAWGSDLLLGGGPVHEERAWVHTKGSRRTRSSEGFLEGISKGSVEGS